MWADDRAGRETRGLQVTSDGGDVVQAAARILRTINQKERRHSGHHPRRYNASSKTRTIENGGL